MSLETRVTTKNLEPAAAILEGAIEPGIFDLVVALNSVSGGATIASCHGHGRAKGLFTRALIDSTPYVLFKAPAAFAQRLSMAIEGNGRDKRLSYAWHLGGYFHPADYELVWYIESCDQRISDKWDLLSRHQWDRLKVNADLATLAEIVKVLRE
jgi:hypothetical protein